MTSKKKMQLGLLARHQKINRNDLSEESRTLEISFSSEQPYKRYFGTEILSHKADHVDLGFMASGSAPLLAGHNHDDQIGVIEKAWIDGSEGIGRALVRFGKSDRAEEYFKDVKDGIRSNISVGYHINKMELQGSDEDKGDEYLVTRWTPMEASVVAVPADTSIGIGRSDECEVFTEIINKNNKEAIMSPEEGKVEGKQEINVGEVQAQERARIEGIRSMGKQYDMTEESVEKSINSGLSVEGFRAIVMDKVFDDAKKTPQIDMSSFSKNDHADMSKYSFVKALREAGEGRLSGLEKEMHEQGIKDLASCGRTVQGQLSIPFQILAQRDLTDGTANQGGYTVATDLLAGSFIELLQNAMKVKQMGATVLDNLVGNITIPTQATGATAAWEGENDAGAESSPTFGQVALSPNRVGTYTEVSKQLMVQSSLAVDNLVKKLLAESIALAIDSAALHGSGASNQPTGIAATSGIGSVAGGTNGLAPTWGHIVELETDVAVANADIGRMGYLTNAKVRGKLKTTAKVSSTDSVMVWGMDNRLNGYNAEVSNQVSSTLTKGTSSGVCSAIFFGNWADLIIAQWGGLDVVVDPYSLATTNLTRITANTYADVGVRHAASFSAMLDALTA